MLTRRVSRSCKNHHLSRVKGSKRNQKQQLYSRMSGGPARRTSTQALHYVPSSLPLPRPSTNFEDYLLGCFEGIQKADEERHCLPSPRHPAEVLRLFQCHYRHSSDPSQNAIDQSQGADDGKVDKVAGSHCQCPVRILCDPRQRRWCGKFRDVMLLEIYPLTCVTTGIPTCECDIHWHWSPPPSEHFP
jgi:hypothetical protein